jgi:CDP-diacylglycerol--serine O-phosphatidyltransferase
MASRSRPRQRHFSMIRDFHVADFFTLANGGSGTASVFLAIEHARQPRPEHVYGAALLVVAALVFDVLDGRIARRRHGASPLGRELDSLADVISFGVAPACLAYAVGMDGELDAICLLYFAACGISRLARYNVTADALAGASGKGKVTYFEGTPIPTSVVLVVLLAVLAALGRLGTALPLGAVKVGAATLHPLVLLFVISGSLMISKTLRIPKP